MSPRLASPLLDPDPVELGTGSAGEFGQSGRSNAPSDGQGKWSGEATRNIGFRPDDQHINIEFGNESKHSSDAKREVPVWITESTVSGINNEDTR